jgi:hypothetical protein
VAVLGELADHLGADETGSAGNYGLHDDSSSFIGVSIPVVTGQGRYV